MNTGPAALIQAPLPINSPSELCVLIASWFLTRMVGVKPPPKLVAELSFLL